MHLTIVRHGETEWNLEKRFQGWADSPLTATGREQVRATAAALRGRVFDAYVASTLGRARETAAIIGETHVASFVPMEEFREIHCGDLAGFTVAEFLAAHPEFDDGSGHLIPKAVRPIEGSEPEEHAFERIRAGLRTLLRAHPDGRVLLVAHEGVVLYVRFILEGIPIGVKRDMSNGEVAEFEVRPGVLD